ncbi:MAG: hypothetical protein CMO74_13995 [Verrucomicrobiales bacterium]|nr:hypothetical protein [Verrucomicrobiales bacterium]|tara:strand:+ start:53438 stop:53674 length:237 start_codon:yes stop_codon:yes gene_type:complete
MDTLRVSEHHLKVEADPFRMKLIAEAISEYVKNHQLEDDTTLNDFRYNMEVVYQDYHCLMPDNWDYVEEDREVVYGAF